MKFTLNLNDKLVAYLSVLKDSGLEGMSLHEICERLICEGIERRVMAAADNPTRERLRALMAGFVHQPSTPNPQPPQ